MTGLTSRTTLAVPGPRVVGAVELARAREQAPGSVLAAVRFGMDGDAGDPPWLEGGIPNARLAGGPVAELWPAAGSVERIDLEDARAAHDGAALFAILEVPDIDGGTLESRTFHAYRRLLGGIERAGYPHLIRVWNFVPRINDRSSGLERYMLFCRGRSDAFAAHHGAGCVGLLPAASAVGTAGDTLFVHALAAREPGRHVENPRQVSAYRYPPRYGPKSPSFARATLAPRPWPGALFVSGTASIVGHESVFPGDPERQAAETITNIEAVLDAAGVPGSAGRIGARLASLRVYVRCPGHVDAIRSVLERTAGPGVPTAWIHADVCREELLVEIEAAVLAPVR